MRRGRGGGAFVRDSWSASSGDAVRRTLLPRRQEFEQLFDLRGLVEGMVAATAARRRRPEDLVPMREALDAHLSATTPREERAADTAFHRAVCDATHNPQIARLSRDLLTRISLGFPTEPWGRAERTHFHRAGEGHTALYAAIAAGEPERAEEIAREHFMISAELIRGVLARVKGEEGEGGEGEH